MTIFSAIIYNKCKTGSFLFTTLPAGHCLFLFKRHIRTELQRVLIDVLQVQDFEICLIVVIEIQRKRDTHTFIIRISLPLLICRFQDSFTSFTNAYFQYTNIIYNMH